MQAIKIFSLFFLLSILASCEKDITIDLDKTTEKLVVDASIETDQAPLVILSRSLDYFSKITPELLSSSFVRDAEVFISDGSRKMKLKSDSVSNGVGYSIVFYTNDPGDPGNAIIGRLNASYSLEIKVGGKVYTATTTIPDTTRRIDSLWWEKVDAIEDSNKVKLIIKATDRPGFGDYIRYFTKTNQEPFYPGLNSAYDDQVIDGTTYVIPVDRGVNKNEEIEDDAIFFNRGDTVTLKLCNIDRATYDFWRTFEFSFQSIGNPFSSPTRILGNVSGNALGVFAGYAAQYRTIFIPPR